MSHEMTKPTKMSVRPAKTQISLGIHPVWSESSLCAQCVAKDPTLLHADCEDSDQTGRMPRLIWVFAGRTAILLVLSCRGSYTLGPKYRRYIWLSDCENRKKILRKKTSPTPQTCLPPHTHKPRKSNGRSLNRFSRDVVHMVSCYCFSLFSLQ